MEHATSTYRNETLNFDLVNRIIYKLITYSRSSLARLSKQDIFGIDVIFSKFKETNLITVVYPNSNGKIESGCVGIEGVDSTGNIHTFANATIAAAILGNRSSTWNTSLQMTRKVQIMV